MIRRIMVPLDGSAFGEYALRRAAVLARRHRATLDLAHVHEVASLVLMEGVPLIDAGVELEGLQSDRTYLDDALKRVAALGLDATATLLDGPTVAALEARAEELDVDLIVMATHGRGPLSRAWLGSVADGLARHTSRPLLLVRPPESADALDAERPALDSGAPTLRRVLLPVDDVAHARLLLDSASDVAEPGAVFVLLHVARGASADDANRERLIAAVRPPLEQVAADARARGCDVQLVVDGARDVAGCILEIASRTNADLIALTTHGRGTLSRLVFGSVTDKVLRGASLPVLMRKPER
ncbi:MAG TPA: universal stress protein [Longimicrobiales bacterium]